MFSVPTQLLFVNKTKTQKKKILNFHKITQSIVKEEVDIWMASAYFKRMTILGRGEETEKEVSI